MPNRYGDNQPDPDEEPQPPPAPNHQAAAAQRLAAIHACHMCDTDGYRGTQVCDHTDHTDHAAAAQRGIALIRTQMGWQTTKTQSQPPSTHPRHNP